MGRVRRTSRGSRLVAKAWTDPAFKARLLEDGAEVSKEIGIDWAERPAPAPRVTHEFSRARRYTNVASCDRLHALLVLSAPNARHVTRMVPFNQLPRTLVRWPRQVLAEFGLALPPGWIDKDRRLPTRSPRFMVLPVRPGGTENWTEEQRLRS